jgi:hypothetical protein
VIFQTRAYTKETRLTFISIVIIVVFIIVVAALPEEDTTARQPDNDDVHFTLHRIIVTTIQALENLGQLNFLLFLLGDLFGRLSATHISSRWWEGCFEEGEWNTFIWIKYFY